jgi:16S rRNA (guanine527-N7)-methyltransferase
MSVVEPPDAPALPAGFWEAVGWTAERKADAQTYLEMLESANVEVNLVGASTLAQFWVRHFIDSAQLLWFAPRAVTWADLGSGAGLPGLVLAILLKGRPGAAAHLVESTAKRCRFLSAVIARLDLPAVVHQARAETLRLRVELVTARACAPLDRLLEFAEPYLKRGAQGLFLKGADVETELATARRHWRFEAGYETSLSDERGRLVSIRNLSRVPKR